MVHLGYQRNVYAGRLSGKKTDGVYEVKKKQGGGGGGIFFTHT